MSKSYYRARHLTALQIDQMEKIAGVIEPACCIKSVLRLTVKD